MIKSITPFLWFDKQAAEAAQFYVDIFPNSRITAQDALANAPRSANGLFVVPMTGVPHASASRRATRRRRTSSTP